MSTRQQGIYVSRTFPVHWFYMDGTGAIWMVDTQPGGWGRRQPYHGHAAALDKCRPAVAQGLALASGAPETLAMDEYLAELESIEAAKIAELVTLLGGGAAQGST
jgi:hypothetical protein